MVGRDRLRRMMYFELGLVIQNQISGVSAALAGTLTDPSTYLAAFFWSVQVVTTLRSNHTIQLNPRGPFIHQPSSTAFVSESLSDARVDVSLMPVSPAVTLSHPATMQYFLSTPAWHRALFSAAERMRPTSTSN